MKLATLWWHAQREDGTLNCWGGDSFGQVSNGPTQPVRTYGLSDSTGCAVDFNGQIECWGYDTGAGVMSPPAGELFLWMFRQYGLCNRPIAGGCVLGNHIQCTRHPEIQRSQNGSEVTCHQTLDGNVHCFGTNETLFDLPDADYEQFDIASATMSVALPPTGHSTVQGKHLEMQAMWTLTTTAMIS